MVGARRGTVRGCWRLEKGLSNMNANISDVELVREAQAGDRDSLDVLVRRVSPRLQAHLRRLPVDQDTSEDLVQDTLLVVLRSLGSLRQPERFWAWVFRIATNKARQHYRDDSRHPTVRLPGNEEAYLPPGGEHGWGVLTTLLRRETRTMITEAMSDISDRYRCILSLRHFELMPYVKIAALLGCSEVGARATFFRAKQALRRELGQRGQESTLAA